MANSSTSLLQFQRALHSIILKQYSTLAPLLEN